jgi:MarR family transcriptional regulator, organic hydroperoxide resistance regulator
VPHRALVGTIRYHYAMPTAFKEKAPAVAPKRNISASRVTSSARVLRQFRIVMNAVKAHFRQVEKSAGVGGAQLWALSVIQSNPGIGMNDLAHAMDVHQSTASNLVKALVAQKMVVAAKTGADRRAVTLEILPDGNKVLRKAPAPFSGVLPDALASLDAQTLHRLEKDLGALIVALNADERAANTLLADL